MADRKIKCESCGHEVSAERILNAGLTSCPVCGDVFPVALLKEQQRSSLNLRENRSLNKDYKSCPHCEGLSPISSRICTHCGYDWETGRRKQTVYQKKRTLKQVVYPTLAVLCLGATVWITLNRWTGSNSDSTESQTDPLETVDSAQQESFRQWKENFETKHPMLSNTEEAALEQTTGRILRGKILDIKSDRLNLFTAIGRESVAFEDLTPSSRAQVDAAFRSRLIQEERVRITGEE